MLDRALLHNHLAYSKALRQVAILSKQSEQFDIYPQELKLSELLQTNLNKLKELEKNIINLKN